ncbi:unnamed protein product [Leuciscus chuanchicus]
MAAKNTKQSKKDQKAEASGDDGKEVNMAAIASLLEEHRVALSADFNTAVSTLEVKTRRNTLRRLLRSRHTSHERVQALETTCAILTESNAKLLAKVVDLESQLLAEVFGDGVLESPPECDRAHRSLSDKPKPGQRPRPVIMRLHKFQQKEKIIREARAMRGKLHYRGTPISICEDYALEVMEQRSKYREVLSELYNLGLKPALLFPVRLTIVTKVGDRRRFASVTEAKDYIASIRRAEV